MADNIDIPLEASGEDGINRLISAVDRLVASLSKMGTATGPEKLRQQIDAMQGSITTGLAEISNKMEDFGRSIRAEREKTNNAILKAQVDHDNRLHAQANKFHDRQIEIDAASENKRAAALQAIIEKRDVEELSARVSSAAKIQAIVEKRDVEEYATRSSANAALQAIIEKRDLDEYATRSANAAKIQAITEKRDVEEYNERAAAGARLKALTEQQQLDLYQIKAAAQEKERVLNTSFLTSSLQQQIATAEKASVYSSLGGNASAKFGSAAAGVNIAELRKQYELMPAAVKASQSAIESHNHAMEEAHTLARGLAGGIGALWLSYGSLVPLAAGAAIASSLKGVVEVGKEVEYQLQFVAALSRETVPLDSFLRITDGTVVSVKAAAEGMRALAQNGLDVKQSLQVLPDVLNLSVIGELGVEQAALAATGALSAFGLQITEIGRVGDILAQTAASSNTSVKALMESLKQGSIAASIYGVSIEETAAALGTLAKVNIVGTQAGTAYNNLLTSLYAPSKKAAEAIKTLGIETANADGSLKNSSVVLLELRNSLAKYSESAQAAFIGDITTNRGAKAVATLLQYLDEYDKKIGEAKNSTGFMSDAVLKLEDTVEGSFKRLQNSASASFTRAFSDAAPALQSLVDQLARVARSDGAVKLLAGLATGAISLTRAVVDNASAIGTLVGAYVAFSTVSKIIINVGEAWKVYTVGVEAATTATALFGVASRGAMALLGPIAAAIAVATTAWALYQYQTDKQGNADQKLTNSIQTHIDMLKNETKALEERNKALRGETGVKTEQPTDSEQALDRMQLLQSEYSKVNTALKKAISTDAAVMFEGERTNALMLSSRANLLKKQLDAARAMYTELDALTVNHDREAQTNKDLSARASLLADLEKFAKKGVTLTTIGGQSVSVEDQTNSAARAKALEANTILEKYKQGLLSTDQAMAEFIQTRREYNALLLPAPAKQDNDSIAATLQHIQLEKQLFDIKNKTALQDLAQQKTSGSLGELGYLREKLVLEKDALGQAAATAAAEANAVKDADKKQAALAKYQNLVITSFAKTRELSAQEQIAEDAYVNKLQQDNLATEAETYKKKGNLLDAYLTEFDSKYGTLIKGLQADLAGGRLDVALEDLLNADGPKAYAKALAEYNKVLAETIRLRNLAAEKAAGVAGAIFGQSQQGMSQALASLSTQLDDLKKQSGPGAGLSAIFSNAQAAMEAYEKGLPQLISLQQQLQGAAAQTGRPEDLKAANDATKHITDLGVRVRAAWTDIGNAIGTSLTSAFGKGGTALGGLLKATIAYGVRRKEIDDQLKNTSKDDPVKYAEAVQKAATDGASAQISAYASMAEAAKGYFTQGSVGYQAMGAAEKAFRVVELAETLRMFAVKSSTMMGLLGLKVATDAESIASEGAYTASSLLLTAARSTARGVEAAVSAMAGWPFPLNFIALGATLAAVASLGIKVMGGGGGGSAPMSSAQRQATNGTGSVLGDANAKSESIANSLKNIEKDSGLGLVHSASMDNSLKQLVAGISGLSSLLVRGTTLTAPVAGNTMGMAEKFVNSQLGTFALGGIIGSTINKLTGGLASSILGKIAGGIFGGGTSVTDVGLTAAPVSVGALGAGVNISQYTDTKTKGGWFSSDKYRTQLTSLGSEVNNQFAMIFSNLANTITTAATAIGLGGDEFAQHLSTFVIDIKNISTKGLTGDEIQKALETALSKLGDDMAKFGVSGLEQFQKVGEGYLETLTRVANDYIQVSDVLSVLGKSFNATGVAAVNLSESLISSAGSLETLTTNTKFFVDNFLTEAEKMAPITQSVQAALSRLGQSNITTQDQFKKLVLSQDLNTTSGQAMYTALLAIAPQFKQITDYANELAGVKVKSASDILSERKSLQDELDQMTLSSTELLAKQRDALDASNRALFDQVQAHKEIQAAYDDESKALESAISKSQSFVDSLKKFKSDLVLGSLSPLTPMQKYQEARQQLISTAAAAQGGDATAQNNFTSAAQAFLEASKVANASGAQFVADFSYVRTLTEQTQASAEKQVDVATASLAALKMQVTGLAQVDASVKTVAQAIRDLTLAGGMTPQNMDSQRAAIETLYESLLGRQGKTAGLDFWTNALKSGVSIQQIASDFVNSPEYQRLHSGTAATTLGTSATTPVYAQITDVSNMADVTARLDSLIQATAQMAAQLQAMKTEQQQQVADEISAQFTATKQAADQIASAITAATSATLAAQQSTVAPS